MEDKKPHKKQKKEKEKGDLLEGLAPKRREKKRNSSAVVDSPVDKLVEGEESKGTRPKEKKKKKKDKLVDNVMEVESATVQETKAPEESQREKKERKRKRDNGDDGPLSPQPKKKSKKVQSAEETKSKENSSQVENAKPVKKVKSQKVVPDNTEPTEKSKKKKRKNKTGFPDPGEDDGTGLSDQARKALTYAFTQFHDPKHWKFNKASQNWLVRNFWSVAAIPEKYEELVVKYLSAVQGNARENLIQTCRAAADEAIAPTKEEIATEQKGTIGGTLIDASSAPAPSQDNRKETRARALLQALAPNPDS